MIAIGRRALVAALVVVVAAGTAGAQEPEKKPSADPAGLLTPMNEVKHRKKDGAPGAAMLDVLRELSAGITASGKTVRLKDMSFREKGSVLTLELDDESAVYAVKKAVNDAPGRITLQEFKIAPDPKTGRVLAHLRVAPRSDAAPPEKPEPIPVTKDLGQYLTETATQSGIKFKSFERRGVKAPDGMEKVAYQFVLERVGPGDVAQYLCYLEATWPDLAIDELFVKESKGGSHLAWDTTVLVSYTRPKAEPK